MDSVRFGVVGSGYFGGELARIIRSMDGTGLVAVYGGSRAESLSQELGCDNMNSLEELAAREDIDAVIVASPSHLHKEHVLRIAKHGKHVFCEKPVALHFSDCAEMIEACRSANVLFMAGHIMHFMNGVGQVKQWIEDGEIGKPIVCHSERTGWEDKQAVVSWKKIKATSGGHLFHHIHELDFLQSIMGPAVSVCAAGGNLAHHGDGFGDEEDVLLITLEFADGTFATMQYGSGFRWGEHYIKINGTEGAILLDMKNSEVKLKKGGQIITRPLHDSEEENLERAMSYREKDAGVTYGNANSKVPGWLANLMKKEMACFRDAILGKPIEKNVKHLFDGSAAKSSIATAEAAMQSLQKKKWVHIR